MRFHTLLTMVLFLFLAACHPVAAHPPQNPDASDAAPAVDGAPVPQVPCQVACSALATAGCPEGTNNECVSTFARFESDRMKRTPDTGPGKGAFLTCVMIAGDGVSYPGVRSAADARALGIACGVGK